MTKLIVKPITFQFIFSNNFHKKKTKTQILKLVRKKKKITFILKQQSENNKLMKTHHLQRKKKRKQKLTTEKRERYWNSRVWDGGKRYWRGEVFETFPTSFVFVCCALLQLCLCTLHPYLSLKLDGCTTWFFFIYLICK